MTPAPTTLGDTMQDQQTPPEPPPEGELRMRVRTVAGDRACRALAFARDAQTALDRGDYSAAAVACHRAYQEQCRVEALREVLS